MKTLLQYCDELQLNIVAKRHNGDGKWDVRVSHPWFHNPILSAVKKDTFEDAMAELNGRVSVIENMRTGIERKNILRHDKAARQAANADRDDPERDEWYERFK